MSLIYHHADMNDRFSTGIDIQPGGGILDMHTLEHKDPYCIYTRENNNVIGTIYENSQTGRCEVILWVSWNMVNIGDMLGPSALIVPDECKGLKKHNGNPRSLDNLAFWFDSIEEAKQWIWNDVEYQIRDTVGDGNYSIVTGFKSLPKGCKAKGEEKCQCH